MLWHYYSLLFVTEDGFKLFHEPILSFLSCVEKGPDFLKRLEIMLECVRDDEKKLKSIRYVIAFRINSFFFQKSFFIALFKLKFLVMLLKIHWGINNENIQPTS